MFSLGLWVVAFIIGMVVLVKASDLFTEAAERVGLALSIPPFVVGVTIVSIGTSLPELTSSIIAMVVKAPELVIGNIVGSNITNIFLVLGLAAVVGKKLKISHELMLVDLPLFVGSSFMLIATVWDGVLSGTDALFCLAGFIIYLIYTISTQQETKTKKHKHVNVATVVMLLVSAVAIYVSAKLSVEAVVQSAEILGIGASVVAMTAFALGTSLPEIVVSITAAAKGKAEIAVGNILGSNIFNALAIAGVAGLISPIPVPPIILTFGLPLLFLATLMYFFITQDKRITKWEGWLLLVFYGFFLVRIGQLV